MSSDLCQNNSGAANGTSSKCMTMGEFIGYMYVLTPISVIGVVVNALTLLVFRNFPAPLTHASFVYLLAIALANLITCALVAPIGVVRCVPLNSSYQEIWKQIYEIYIYLPIANTFGTASVWLTTVLTYERYIVVAHSHTCLGLHLSRPRHPYHMITTVSLSAFIISAPYFLVFEVSADGSFDYTEWGASDGYSIYSWCRLLLTKMVPIVVVAVCNGLLIYTVWAARRRRLRLVGPRNGEKGTRSRGPTEMSEGRVTTMLCVISAVFVLCELLEPFVHSGVYSSLFGKCSLLTSTYTIILLVANVLEMVLFSANFFIYCIFYRHFTSTLRSLLCKCTCCALAVNDVNTVQVRPEQHSNGKLAQSQNNNKITKKPGSSVEEHSQVKNNVHDKIAASSVGKISPTLMTASDSRKISPPDSGKLSPSDSGKLSLVSDPTWQQKSTHGLGPVDEWSQADFKLTNSSNPVTAITTPQSIAKLSLAKLENGDTNTVNSDLQINCSQLQQMSRDDNTQIAPSRNECDHVTDIYNSENYYQFFHNSQNETDFKTDKQILCDPL